jgi:aspartyl-tRNA(Asn)/glutamyl-tRNA(Gln) amidotransferase subunit C
MAELDAKTVKSLIELSRIDCSEEEQAKLLKDLHSILAYIDQLNEVDTTHVSPCNHVLEEVANVMREDQVGTPLARELFLSNAPSHVGGMIRVPPILKPNS